jgi:hypothetical protein
VNVSNTHPQNERIIVSAVRVICVTTLLLVLGLCCTSCSIVCDTQFQQNVAVIKTLDKPLGKGTAISVSVVRAGSRNNPTSRRGAVYDSSLSFLEADLRQSLRDIGFVPKFDEAAALWGIDCEFNETWGRLVLGRNGRLHMVYYGKVNVKLINKETKDIVGEIEYHRPRFYLPPITLAEEMARRLMQGGAEVP